MAKEMLINVSEGEECRIALLDNGKLEELYMERTSSTSHVGNIYKGKVTNVEPSIQAAFVDFGLGRNGFLHISDLMPSYFGRSGNDIQESVGKKMARRDRPPIQRCLRRGDEIIVQIIKEGIGTKGPTLSTYLSIPGRILVMMPGMGKMGVSKKIEDEAERKRLRTILDSLKPPKGVGFIIRTAGIGKSKAEIQRDLTYLSRLWQQIEKKRDSGPGAMELYTEGDLVTRTVRDVFSTDVDRIIIDSKDVAKRVKDVIKIAAPRTRNKVETYEEPLPLFHKYGIERDIELMYSRHVPLPSGGSLVIDSTEAIVAIDVNSGKFRDHSDAEMTAFKTDMEAAEEIPRQLKLRDLGGVIICDFIDLRYERHRRELEEKLHENFKKDRAKTKVLRMSQFGIIEITRQRMRPSLKRSIYFDCPHCKGAGLVKTPESMSLDVMRRLAIAANHEKVMRVELSVCPDVSFYLLNKKRSALASLETVTGKKIVVRTNQSLGLDEMVLALYDARDGLVMIDELGLASSQPPHTTQLGTRAHGAGRGRQDGRGRGGRGGEQRGGGRGGRPEPQRGGRGREEDRFELDDAEDAAEEREERREHVAADPALVASIAPKIVHDVPTRRPGAQDPSDELDDEGPAEPVNTPPIAQDEQRDDADEDEEELDSSVVDVDDGHSALGDRPAGEWDRHGDRDGGGQGHRRRRRGRRGGRGGNGEGGNGGQAQGQRPQEQRDREQRPSEQRDQRSPQQQGKRPPQPGARSQQPQGQRSPQPQGQRSPQAQGQQRRPDAPAQRPPQRPPQQPNRLPPAAAMASYGEEPEDLPGPGNEKFPGEAGHKAEGGGAGAGADAEGGGKRRRRRRGGRRHRRRRERENEMRQQAGLEGLPQDEELNSDDDASLTTSAAVDDAGAVYEGAGPHANDSVTPARQAPEERLPEEAEDEDESELELEPDAAEAEAEHGADESAAPEEAPAPAKKKRASRAKGATPKSSRTAKPKAAKAATSRRATPKRTPPKKSADKHSGGAPAKPSLASVIETPVVKTGSADKHLVDDDPAETAPRRQSRRYDLDEIPDDYD